MYCKIDYESIVSCAYLDLFWQESITTFPIKFPKYQDDRLEIISFQTYARLSGLSINQLSVNGKYKDGYYVKELRPNLKLILYNEEAYIPRQDFTLFHEVGHFKLDHNAHGEKEEKEANFYAAQFLSPNCIIKEISERGYTINKELIKKVFGLSNDAAAVRMNYVKEHPYIHTNSLDGCVVYKFINYLDRFFPSLISDEERYNFF